MDYTPKTTEYAGEYFRSRIEARWAIVFDTLEVEWGYELQHYDFGLKHQWDDHEFQEHLDNVLENNYYEDEDEVIRGVYREKYERNMYLPDFFLPEFEHWVEIKGKSPNWEEQTKACRLARATNKPVTILWGYIPDPKAKIWGDCAEVYLGDMNIIACLVIECGVKALEKAFTSARQAHFKDL